MTMVQDWINHKFNLTPSKEHLSYFITWPSTLEVISLIWRLASCVWISSCSFTYSSLFSCSFLAFSSLDLGKKRPYELSKTDNKLKSLSISKMKKSFLYFSPLLKCRTHYLFHKNLYHVCNFQSTDCMRFKLGLYGWLRNTLL